MKDYEYYYNDVPGIGLCRNNLIYTSLISKDQKTFVQWYHNDSDYHKGANEVVDPDLMLEKWNREIKFLTLMERKFSDLVPKILDIDEKNKKIYLEIDGLDFWNRARCNSANYDQVISDWQDQMIKIILAHRSLGLFKYSMHPSSYFVVDGQLKSINYFFCYSETENPICIKDVTSHIHSNRQIEIKRYTDKNNIDWNTPQDFTVLETVCWESFRTNYPAEFIEKIKCLN